MKIFFKFIELIYAPVRISEGKFLTRFLNKEQSFNYIEYESKRSETIRFIAR